MDDDLVINANKHVCVKFGNKIVKTISKIAKAIEKLFYRTTK